MFAVLTAAMLLTSGAVSVAFAGSPSTMDAQTEETPDGDEVIDEFVEQMSNLDTVQFTRTSELTFNNQTSTNTVRVDADLDSFQKRTETVNASVGSDSITTVQNDSALVRYDSAENTVSKYEVQSSTLLPRIESLANESLVNYEYLGMETVDGQETYALGVTPAEEFQRDTDVETETTVYLNTETYFPVRIDSETRSEEYNHSSTTTYENVTLNEEIPDETFDLDVPDDATDPTTNVGPEITDFDAHDELAAATNVSVPDAEIGDGFSFDHGTTIDGENYYGVTLAYSDGNRTVTVSTQAGETGNFDYDESEMYEAVEVGETTGYLYTNDEFTLLSVEADKPYTIYGEINNETAVNVAESIIDE
jgi:outer membrane lipoprotein-sorting protein